MPSDFGAVVPDVCMADESQVKLFATLGAMRSPFRGVAEWPWIDECFSAASKQFLEKNGGKKWHLTKT